MNNHPLMQGIGLGVVAAAVVGAVFMSNQKPLKRAAHKAMRAVGGVMDDVVENVTSGME